MLKTYRKYLDGANDELANYPRIEDGCKIPKTSEERIVLLSYMGYQLFVVPRKDYEAWQDAESSLNYVSEGLSTCDLGLDYITVVPDTIRHMEMVDILRDHFESEYHMRKMREETYNS